MVVGDVSEEEESAVREEMGRVIAFYAERYDAVVAEFTLYFSVEPEPVAALYRERHGRDAPLVPGWFGGWVTGTRESAPEAYVASRGDLAGILSHEYYHLLQYDLLRRFADGTRSAPAWLIEGTAEYGEMAYVWRDSPVQADFLWRWEPFARESTPFASVMRNEDPFPELALGGIINASLQPYYYTFAAAAVSWLVERSGNGRADLAYWSQLAETDDWERAFEAAFGITVDGFVEEFEAYRADLGRDQPQIRGHVVDLNGSPLAGVRIAVWHSNEATSKRTVSRDDGTFALPVLPEQEYRVRLGRVADGSEFASVFFGPQVDPDTGYANVCHARPLEVGHESIDGLVIRVSPEVLEGPDPLPCNEGVPGYYRLEMAFFGPGGEPIREPVVSGAVLPAERLDSRWGGGCCTHVRPDGIASRMLAEGSYALEIFHSTDGASRPIGWHGGESGFTTDRSEAAVFEVSGANVRIEIRLPADPADMPTARY